VQPERRRQSLLVEGRLLVEQRRRQRLDVVVVGGLRDPLVVDLGVAQIDDEWVAASPSAGAARRASTVASASTLGSPYATQSLTFVTIPR
jgi:hypothetical protein